MTIHDAKWMVVQDIYGDDVDTIVPMQHAQMCYTLVQLDPDVVDLRDAMSPRPITLADDSDATVIAAVNQALGAMAGRWEVYGALKAPGSCLDFQRPIWIPCGNVGPNGGTVQGRVIGLRRMQNQYEGKDPKIRIVSDFDIPDARTLITRYCALIQYEKV